jgi:acetyltransferase-like isoleucine patch superfamily enzyme
MEVIGKFVRKVKRAETPFYATLKRLGKRVIALNPPVPAVLFPLLRLAYRARIAVPNVLIWLRVVFLTYPVFRSKCDAIGPRLRIELLPHIAGSVRISIGSDVFISGRLSVTGCAAFEMPELVIGDRVFLGSSTSFSIGRSIVIEDDVLIAAGCSFADYSPHPKDSERRASGALPEVESARPIRIGRKAWVGARCTILPGVSIGEGAIVGAGSVVTRDVPPFQVAAGSPARVVSKEPSVREG